MKEQQAKDHLTQLQGIKLINDGIRLDKLTQDEIDTQLKVHCLNDPDISLILSMKKNHVKKALVELHKAIAHANTWWMAAQSSEQADNLQVGPSIQSQSVQPSTHQGNTVYSDQMYTQVVDNDLDPDMEWFVHTC